MTNAKITITGGALRVVKASHGGDSFTDTHVLYRNSTAIRTINYYTDTYRLYRHLTTMQTPSYHTDI